MSLCISWSKFPKKSFRYDHHSIQRNEFGDIMQWVFSLKWFKMTYICDLRIQCRRIVIQLLHIQNMNITEKVRKSYDLIFFLFQAYICILAALWPDNRIHQNHILSWCLTRTVWRIHSLTCNLSRAAGVDDRNTFDSEEKLSWLL